MYVSAVCLLRAWWRRRLAGLLMVCMIICARHVRWQLFGCKINWGGTRLKKKSWTMLIRLTSLFYVCCLSLLILVISNLKLMPRIQLCNRLPSPNGESAVDCSALASMPMISFTIGTKTFELAPEQVILIVLHLSFVSPFNVIFSLWMWLFHSYEFLRDMNPGEI